MKRIPKMFAFGQQGEYNILLLELLGQSLKMLLKFVGRKFSMGTTLKVSIQILNIIKKIHKSELF